MFRNRLLMISRSITRGKFYAAINITGLATGLSCFFLIALFIHDELSYDRFHHNAQRIYRVIGILELDGQGERSSSCPFPVGPSLANDYPDLIEHTVRFFNFQDPQHTLKTGDQKFNESRIFMADSNVFSVFDFPLLKGDPKKALIEPNTIVLTTPLAEKYFGKGDPIGKVIRFDGVVDLTVTGVLDALPQQSHIHFDALISFSTTRAMMPNQLKNWVWNPNWTYVMLRPGIDAAQLEKQLPYFVQKYYPDFLKPQVKHLLQPLTDIHLHSKYEYEIEANSDISYIYIFVIIGIFILLIACINFMNLATARSSGRAREVGIRKVAGAQRSQLISQFLTESVALSLLSALLSIALTAIALPFFNHITGKQITFNYTIHAGTFGILMIAGFITGIFSGAYPAFYLSSFMPVKVLKGNLSSGSRNQVLRRLLVILQFSIATILITGTITVYRQLTYMRSADPGFNKEHMIILPVRPPMGQMFDAFIEELRSLNHVTGVTRMNDVAGKHHNTHEYNFEGMQPGKWIYFPSLLVDEEFIPVMNIQLLAGRNFSKSFKRDDSLAVIVNEAMVKHMKWGSNEKAIGQQFYTPSGHEKIIGVVKNFNYEPMHRELGPFVLDMPAPKHKIYWTRYIGVRISGPHHEIIEQIGKVWNKYTNEYPYTWFFLDDDLNKQYQSQENLGKLTTAFSLLAVFIACLGLFALASFSTEQRTKETGIRKVMGARVSDIILTLSVDFIKPVIAANLIAWPISWYIMNEWLKGFAHRCEFNHWVPLYVSFLTVMIALLTVIFKAWKAALTNPVKSLRYE